jgi:hypothetical protein
MISRTLVYAQRVVENPISKDKGAFREHVRSIGTDPKGGYSCTAIEFVDDHVLLAQCEYTGGNSLQVTRLPVEWLYLATDAADGEQRQ